MAGWLQALTQFVKTAWPRGPTFSPPITGGNGSSFGQGLAAEVGVMMMS